ncbi:Conserved_hypothetical protein [Hexamita inflata]|uniref:Uncharacterized protein n=1 Tax=Hexamita inflata TaxID=28002 RepID=A0AA86NSR4_9EUKA|nr:Conserved hypothetical protein [Hexamita inflata]
MHPVTQYFVENCKSDKIVLSPYLFLKLTSSMELEFNSLIKDRAIGGLYKQYGEDLFIENANKSEVVRIDSDTKRVHFLVKVQQCPVIIATTTLNSTPIEQITQNLTSILDVQKIGIVNIITLSDVAEADKLLVTLTENNYKTPKKDLETKRDAYIRHACQSGTTREQIAKAKRDYEQSQSSQVTVKIANPKEQGYEKSTEEFKKESGYERMKVVPIQLDRELTEIYEKHAEQKVDIVECSIFTDAQDQIWSAKVPPMPKQSK